MKRIYGQSQSVLTAGSGRYVGISNDLVFELEHEPDRLTRRSLHQVQVFMLSEGPVTVGCPTSAKQTIEAVEVGGSLDVATFHEPRG